jgi:hypothetical protein
LSVHGCSAERFGREEGTFRNYFGRIEEIPSLSPLDSKPPKTYDPEKGEGSWVIKTSLHPFVFVGK